MLTVEVHALLPQHQKETLTVNSSFFQAIRLSRALSIAWCGL